MHSSGKVRCESVFGFLMLSQQWIVKTHLETEWLGSKLSSVTRVFTCETMPALAR